MPLHKSYDSYLIESLKDPAEAAAYLDAVLEEGDLDHLVLALKNVAEARSNLNDATNEPNSDWGTDYRSLIEEETPILQSIAQLLSKLGFKLSVTVKPDQAA